VLLYLGTLLVSVPIALPFVHLVASARDMGLPPADALGLLGQLGLGSIAGRFLLGALADMLGRRRVFLLCCAGVAAATLLWAASPGRAGLTVFALAFGMLYGGFVALLPAFTVDCFGPRAAGRALGLLYTGRAAALFAAPVAAAALFAAGYTLPLAGAAVLGAAGTLVLGRVTPASRAWSAARGGPGALKVGTEPLPPPMALPPSPSPVRPEVTKCSDL
jgi:MFS family permease